MNIIKYGLFDEVLMKKKHPCEKGTNRFQIVRVGADIKIKCLACGRIMMIDRDAFNSKIKKVIASHEGPIKLDGEN